MSDSADAIVIGAGIIGASIAWRLVQRGLRVTMLDAGRAGGEASWAGAGMLAPGGEIAEWSEWAEFSLHSHRLYPGFVEELRRETGCDIDFQRSGAVEVAAEEADWRALQDRAERQRGWGIASEPIQRDHSAGALLFPDDAIVDPRHVTGALLRACRLRGARIREASPVTGVRSAPGAICVETGAEQLTAAVAVVAAGAWSGAIPFDAELPRSFPLRGHLIGYRLNPGVCPTILRCRDTYLLQRSNGLLIAGSSIENVGFDRRIDPEIVSQITRRAEALLPSLRQAEPPEAWLGFRPACDTLEPQIGRFAGSRLWLAYGHFRNGILLAPATAERVSNEIIATWETDSFSPAGSR